MSLIRHTYRASVLPRIPANGAVVLANNSITTAKYQDGSVTTAKIADANLTTAKYQDLSVTGPKVAAGTLTSDKFGTDAVIIGSRAALASATLNAANAAYNVAGYNNALDQGGGLYVRVSTPGVPRNWHVQNAPSGTWWELRSPTGVTPKQVGALLDNSTNDATAIQAWVDYAGTFGVQALGSVGTAVIAPATTIDIPSNVKIDGLNLLTIRAAVDRKTPLFRASSKSSVSVHNMLFSSSAGAASSSSNSVAVASGVTFTVAAGLNFAVSDPVLIVPTADPTKYMVGTITGYTTTTMTVNVTAVLGSGTFTAWSINHNTGENCALQFISSPSCEAVNNTFTGKFYVGIESRNTDNAVIEKNKLSGGVNRAVYIYATSGTADDVRVLNNHVSGGAFLQYGINCNGSTGGSIRNVLISGNQIENVVFHSIGLGGSITASNVNANECEIVTSAAGVGILVEEANALQPQDIKVFGNNVNQVTGTGIVIRDAFYCSANDNSIANCAAGLRLQQSGATYACQYNSANGNIIRAFSGIGLEVSAATAGGMASTDTNLNKCIGSGGTSTGMQWNALGAPSTKAIGNTSVGATTAYVKSAALAVDQFNT